ncbi:unnamed protein product, partial [Mesorhabditis belari]|uniref:Acetyl-CoA hydrolase n=1 Tax=Mesorhabditis belari TaxID=2138241 RepID=A0AAF3FLX1_9BILA
MFGKKFRNLVPVIQIFRHNHGVPFAPNGRAFPISGVSTPKFVSADEAIAEIQSGAHIYIHGHAATPTEITDALCDRAATKDYKYNFHHIILSGKVRWAQPEFYGKIRSNCLFICGGMRQAVLDGAADYTPVFLVDIPKIFYDRVVPLDYAIVSVSPPDEHGYCSLGVDVDCTSAAVNSAKHLIGLVNPSMPRTFGDATIHASQFKAMVETDREIYCKGVPESIGEAEQQIGRLIAENLVDNGATLQLGIGGIPDSTLNSMRDHKDLGIHTELICDGILDLLEANVINNTKKAFMPGKSVASFAYGSRRFFDFVHNNPSFHFASCGWTNHPDIIRRNSKMTAINACIEVDLTGQVVSDSIGEKFYSGFGGQVDFITNACNGYDGKGKSILAMTSRTEKGRAKIVPTLSKGAGVVCTRAHSHYIVTEHGIASLFGKSARQRAYEMIKIAHPDDRASLEAAAFERLRVMPSPNF